MMAWCHADRGGSEEERAPVLTRSPACDVVLLANNSEPQINNLLRGLLSSAPPLAPPTALPSSPP